MQGDSKLQVWVEVLGPFKFLPREVLQGTANTVLAGLMRTLLPIFTRKCAPDMKLSTTFTLNPLSRHAVVGQPGGESHTINGRLYMFAYTGQVYTAVSTCAQW
jgi:hypothetical protein